MCINQVLNRFALTHVVLALLVSALVDWPVTLVQAETVPQETSAVKTYPPYPDVWGYELPWPEKTSRHSGIMMLKKADGDYVAMYIKHITKVQRKNGSCCDLKYEHAGQSFFSGKKWDGKEVGDFSEQHREDLVPREFGKPNPWILTDGSEVQYMFNGEQAPGCSNYLNSSLRVLDPARNVLTEKQLIYFLEKPIKRPVCYPREQNENLIGKQRMVTIRVQGVDSYVIPLEDGTFLLYDQNGNVLMRFDRELNSKSDLVNHKVFVVDRQAMETFVLEYVKQRNLDYNDQTLNDAVYAYMTKLKKAGAQ